MLTSWTDIEVMLLIMEHIFHKERIVFPLSLILGVEHIVFHIGVYQIGQHILVVHFAAITGVGTYCRTLMPISVLEGVQKRYECTLVCRSPI